MAYIPYPHSLNYCNMTTEGKFCEKTMLLQKSFQPNVISHAFLKKKHGNISIQNPPGPWLMLFLVLEKSSIIQICSRVIIPVWYTNKITIIDFTIHTRLAFPCET